MINDVELLRDICENAEMGRDGIMHILKQTEDSNLSQVLTRQLSEYQKTYDTADKMLHERNQEPTSANPMAKMMSYVSSSAKTMMDNSASKIAELMIQGSTMGITNMTKSLHDYDDSDHDVKKLAEKHIKTEQANVDEMKKFL